ncbi:hypothetical protein ACHAPT_013060 [Fusarium lateritium]
MMKMMVRFSVNLSRGKAPADSIRLGGHHASLPSAVATPDNQTISPEPPEPLEPPEAMTGTTGESRFRSDDPAEPHVPNTITVPCHHIRLGDFVMLQGRPCQVIRISISRITGQYRYLGVDLVNKEIFEDLSFGSEPAPALPYMSYAVLSSSNTKRPR